MKKESLILNNLFNTLNENHYDYCVMNNYAGLPDVIPSDVDFAVNKETFCNLDRIIINLANKHDVEITQKIWHGYNKCAFILSPVDITQRFFLQLDFFIDFSGRGYPNLFPIKRLLEDKRKFKNFYIPSYKVEPAFFVQRRIFKGDVSSRHLKYFYEMHYYNQKECVFSIKSIFGKRIGTSLIDSMRSDNADIFNRNMTIYKKKLSEISRSNTNLIYRLKYTLSQSIRAIYRLYYPTGLSIAFVGEDNELKKKLIDDLDSLISGSFHGLIKCRPSNKLIYIKDIFFKVYWGKVTKKKVFINLDSNNYWNPSLSNYFFTKLLPLADVVIYLSKQDGSLHPEQIKLSTSGDINPALKRITKLCLHTQSNRTKRHLKSKFSPTT